MHYQYGVHVIAQPTEISMLFPSSTWFLILKTALRADRRLPAPSV